MEKAWIFLLVMWTAYIPTILTSGTLDVYCQELTDPSGHTMKYQQNGWKVGAIVEYKCLPGSSYYSGEFTKKCVANPSGYGEWVGDDLKCTGCCDFEMTPTTIIVYNPNILQLDPDDIPQGGVTMNYSISSSELNNTFCLETWIDVTRLEQQNTTVIKVSNTFGMIISNSLDNIELLAYLTSNDATEVHMVKLNMEFVKHSNILQITMTRDEEMVGYFLNGVQIFTSVTAEQETPLNETTKEFLVFAGGNVTIYSVHLQNAGCFETETYKNAQTMTKTGCESKTSDNSIRLSCQGDDVLIVDTVEVGQSNNTNGINYMCGFEFNSLCNIQPVGNINEIKGKCDKQNKCTVNYDDYSNLRPDDCDESHNVTAVIKYHCIRKQNMYPRNITTSQSVLSAVNDLSPYDTCAPVPSGTREIAFDLGGCFQINELIINFNISSLLDTIQMFDIKVYSDGEEDDIDNCVIGASVQHSIPVLYGCGDSVFGDRVAIVLESIPQPDWKICNVEIYTSHVPNNLTACSNRNIHSTTDDIVTTNAGTITTDDIVTTNTGPITTDDIVTTNAGPITTDDIVTTNAGPITTDDIVKTNTGTITTDDIVTTNAGPITTDDIVKTNTGTITTDDIVTTNTGTITTDDIVTTNTGPITTDDIVTTNAGPITTDDIVTTNAGPITTDDIVKTNTGTITTDDIVTTNAGPITTDDIVKTNTGTITTDDIVTTNTGTITTDDIVTTNTESTITDDIVTTSTRTTKRTDETPHESSPKNTIAKTTPLMIVFKDVAEEAEKADEYVYIKRIEYEPSEAKYASAVGIPVCVPPIIFISIVIILDLPKIIMDIKQAYNLVVYGTNKKPKVISKAPILKETEPKY
ncbi:unnamed protein product [Owenia fusiformis]|uniref:Uncharacterized protein n=1 Tax=Owenia fusiformis TaxID=6347 RepID=A0A8J1ULW7_OWEFU|nr:unnamed protein product [Owenia fusiformis]